MGFHIFFIIGLLIIYVISIIILRPFRKHRKRKFSTIGLKLSYLIFLLVFFVFIYLLLFGYKIQSEADLLYDSIFNIHFLVFVSATIVPNTGIMMRQQVRKKRVEYNLIFMGVNIFYIAYLFFLIVSGKWALL